MTAPTDLQVLWFVLVGVLFTIYAILDGFDLGVGTLHLLTRRDEHRRTLLAAIGPVWDGNEVWLVTGGGALFAAFPHAYATVFSGFYLALYGLLLALIARAVALEFRNRRPGASWRRSWDVLFSLGSLLVPALLGVALGNVAAGIDLGAGYEFRGAFVDLLRPYPLLVGATTVALFAMHGATYLLHKTEGELREQVGGWARTTTAAATVLVVVTTAATLAWLPHMSRRFADRPVLYLLPLAAVIALGFVPQAVRRGRSAWAFSLSGTVIAALMGIFGASMYPNLVVSQPDATFGLTIANAASSERTLTIMTIIAFAGLPLVIAYTVAVYRIFRGPVRLQEAGY